MFGIGLLKGREQETHFATTFGVSYCGDYWKLIYQIQQDKRKAAKSRFFIKNAEKKQRFVSLNN